MTGFQCDFTGATTPKQLGKPKVARRYVVAPPSSIFLSFLSRDDDPSDKKNNLTHENTQMWRRAGEGPGGAAVELHVRAKVSALLASEGAEQHVRGLLLPAALPRLVQLRPRRPERHLRGQPRHDSPPFELFVAHRAKYSLAHSDHRGREGRGSHHHLAVVLPHADHRSHLWRARAVAEPPQPSQTQAHPLQLLVRVSPSLTHIGPSAHLTAADFYSYLRETHPSRPSPSPSAARRRTSRALAPSMKARTIAPRDPFAAPGEATAARTADVTLKSHPCTLYTKRFVSTQFIFLQKSCFIPRSLRLDRSFDFAYSSSLGETPCAASGLPCDWCTCSLSGVHAPLDLPFHSTWSVHTLGFSFYK